jgi:hypothetical protein
LQIRPLSSRLYSDGSSSSPYVKRERDQTYTYAALAGLAALGGWWWITSSDRVSQKRELKRAVEIIERMEVYERERSRDERIEGEKEEILRRLGVRFLEQG